MKDSISQTAIATLLTAIMLAVTSATAEEVNCDNWISSDIDTTKQFWEVATVETVVSCLNSGFDANARDEDADGETVLHWAALWNDDIKVASALLDAGADINARDYGERTPLHWAVLANENPEAITALLNAGADVNARDDMGGTPLHAAAAKNKNPEVLAVLIDAGADINAIDDYGENALHSAAMWNNSSDIIITLLDAGADGTVVNEDGDTPFALAEKRAPALEGTEAYRDLAAAHLKNQKPWKLYALLLFVFGGAFFAITRIRVWRHHG